MPIPKKPSDNFWSQLDHQLDRIKSEKPSTFDQVRAILLDPLYTHINYVLTHPETGETLTYIEGDVQRGDQISN